LAVVLCLPLFIRLQLFVRLSSVRRICRPSSGVWHFSSVALHLRSFVCRLFSAVFRPSSSILSAVLRVTSGVLRLASGVFCPSFLIFEVTRQQRAVGEATFTREHTFDIFVVPKFGSWRSVPMYASEVEALVCDYIVSSWLLKTVERDRKHLGALKLHRCWETWFERVSLAVEREHVRDKKKLRECGCRIVLEEMTENRHVHVMYTHNRYEYHCYMMPGVLKARCEERLQDVLSRSFG
jgi:hypothetical protein